MSVDEQQALTRTGVVVWRWLGHSANLPLMTATQGEKSKVAEILNALTPPWQGTLMERLGITVTAISLPDDDAANGEVTVTGQMPVDGNTQPFGTLHGGATAALIETLGSVLANLIAEPGLIAVGQHLEVTHLRPVTSGVIVGQAEVLDASDDAVTAQVTVSHDGKTTAVSTLRCKLLPRP